MDVFSSQECPENQLKLERHVEEDSQYCFKILRFLNV